MIPLLSCLRSRAPRLPKPRLTSFFLSSRRPSIARHLAVPVGTPSSRPISSKRVIPRCREQQRVTVAGGQRPQHPPHVPPRLLGDHRRLVRRARRTPRRTRGSRRARRSDGASPRARRRRSIARFQVIVRSQVLKLASPRKLPSLRKARSSASWATSSASSRERSAASAARNTTCWYRSTRVPNAARSPFRASSMSSASLTLAVDRAGVVTVGNYDGRRRYQGSGIGGRGPLGPVQAARSTLI